MNFRNDHNRFRGCMRVLKALAVGWVTTLGATAIISILISGEYLSERSLTSASVMSTMLSASIIAIIAGRKQESGKLLWSIIGGVTYYLSLIGCNALFYDGKYKGLLASCLTILGCSLVCGLLLTRQKHQGSLYYKAGQKR